MIVVDRQLEIDDIVFFSCVRAVFFLVFSIPILTCHVIDVVERDEGFIKR